MNDKKTCNPSIKCSVDTCAYHSGAQNCCSLNSIKVGCCDCAPHQVRGHRVRLLQAGREIRGKWLRLRAMSLS